MADGKPTSLVHAGSTGYDWGPWLDEARGATVAARSMPFMLDPRRLQQQNQPANTSLMYPDIMQTQGMQPIMGPNGKNIAPNLASILGVADPNDASKLPGGEPLNTSQGLAGLIQRLLQLGVPQSQLDQIQGLAKPPAIETGAPAAPQQAQQSSGGGMGDFLTSLSPAAMLMKGMR